MAQGENSDLGGNNANAGRQWPDWAHRLFRQLGFFASPRVVQYAPASTGKNTPAEPQPPLRPPESPAAEADQPETVRQPSVRERLQALLSDNFHGDSPMMADVTIFPAMGTESETYATVRLGNFRTAADVSQLSAASSVTFFISGNRTGWRSVGVRPGNGAASKERATSDADNGIRALFGLAAGQEITSEQRQRFNAQGDLVIAMLEPGTEYREGSPYHARVTIAPRVMGYDWPPIINGVLAVANEMHTDLHAAPEIFHIDTPTPSVAQ